MARARAVVALDAPTVTTQATAPPAMALEPALCVMVLVVGIYRNSYKEARMTDLERAVKLEGKFPEFKKLYIEKREKILRLMEHYQYTLELVEAWYRLEYEKLLAAKDGKT